MKRIASIFLLFTVLFFIFYFNPFFGLMDDASLSWQCKNVENFGYWESYKQFFSQDLYVWGMFRPLYFFLANFQYCFFVEYPKIFFFFNSLLVTSLVLFSIFVFSRYSLFKIQNRNQFVFLTFVFSFIFYRFHDLFLHPSLQEKWVWLFCILAFLGMEKLIQKKGVKFYLFSPFLVLVFFVVKAQSVILILPFTYLLWSVTQVPMKKRVIYVFLWMCVLALWSKKMASMGSYTSRYALDFKFILNQITSISGIFLFFVACLFSFFGVLKKSKVLIFSGLCFGSYFIVMAPWTLGAGYLFSFLTIPFALGFSELTFLLLNRWRVQSFRVFVFTSLWLFAVLVSTYRNYRTFARYHDLRKSLETFSKVYQESDVLYVPCDEASHSIQFYLKEHFQKEVRLHPFLHRPKGEHYQISDSALCPHQLGNRKVEEVYFTPEFSGSFVLQKIGAE